MCSYCVLFCGGCEEKLCKFDGFFLTGLVFPLFDGFNGGACQQRVSSDYADLFDDAIRRDGDFNFYFP